MRHCSLLIAALLLAGCLATPAPAAPTSTPVWLPTQIPENGLIYLPLEPAGTPEANPVLVVDLAIIDAMTQQPVAVDVYIVNAREYREPTRAERMAHNTEQVALKLPAELDGWFVLRVPGDEDWTLRLHYRLKTSRKLSGPIQLKRFSVKDQAATLRML
jgi:hypothetical protein